MYKLTPRMEQHLESDLVRYHELFNGGRCDAWQMEELIVRAIKSDTISQHQPFWKEGGHDTDSDIVVRTNGDSHEVQIKSGRIDKKEMLVLSGYRLGRFKGDLDAITQYLKDDRADIIATPYEKTDDDTGRHHEYKLCYVPIEPLLGIKSDNWKEHGKQFIQTGSDGVEFSLRPSMSWQVWWKIPLPLITFGKTMKVT